MSKCFCETEHKYPSGILSIGYFENKYTGSTICITNDYSGPTLWWDNSGSEYPEGFMKIHYCPVCGRCLSGPQIDGEVVEKNDEEIICKTTDTDTPFRLERVHYKPGDRIYAKSYLVESSDEV